MASIPLNRLPALPADVVCAGGVTEDVNGDGIGVVVDIPPDDAEEEGRFDLILVSLSIIHLKKLHLRADMSILKVKIQSPQVL